MLITISLETSMKKLVRLAAHTLRGSVRQLAFGGSAVISAIFILLIQTSEVCEGIFQQWNALTAIEDTLQ
jgi:hypothetical protein